MIKVKTFFMKSQNPLQHEILDEYINSFLAENDVEVIDIKYSVAAVEGQNGSRVYPSALLIYKTKE